MIAKGAARSGPRQLAVYLMRVERWDTGEPAELLELRSPWAAGIDGEDRHHTADQLIEAFRDWQTLVEGTKQGRDGLYHAEINPEAHYAKNMTPEQWKRAADILAEELGLQDQPRALVLHAGKDDRPHLHVVWQRTDVDTMKVISDGYNYVAHERASARMELEFGHEMIPGKHAKRDRKKQKEFPRQKLTQDEDQFQKRTGLSKEDRIKQITALHAAADSGPALKAALEDAGYVLAKGDRGYVVVDQAGGHSVLARNIEGLKKKDVDAFMAGVELDKLPSIEEAKELQKERRTVSKRESVSKWETGAEAEKPGVETSKFLEGEAPQKTPEPTPAKEDAEIEATKKARQDRKPAPVDPERKQKIVALRAWADGAQAFKKALEDAGYTLARGNTGLVLFSEDGVFSLVRHAGLSRTKLDAFMSPIPLDSLPHIDDLIKAQKEGRQESRFFITEPEAPQQRTPLAPEDIGLGTRMEISALDMAAEAIAATQKQTRPQLDAELEAILKALAKRQEEETAALRAHHEMELRAKEVEMDRQIERDLENHIRIQDEQTEAFLQARKEYRTGIWGFIDALQSRWNPTLAAEKAQAREQERQNFYRRLAKERADYETLIQQSKQLEIENLKERQAQRLRDAHQKHIEEEERYIRDHEESKRILADIEEQQQELERERNDSLREGPPPPKLGK